MNWFERLLMSLAALCIAGSGFEAVAQGPPRAPVFIVCGPTSTEDPSCADTTTLCAVGKYCNLTSSGCVCP